MDFLKKIFTKTPKKEIEKIDIDLSFEYLVVHGEKAIENLNELKMNSEITPLIMGNPKDASLLVENLELAEQSPEEIVKASHEIQFPDWFSERANEDKEFYEIPRGSWPREELPQMGLTAHLNILSRKPHDQVLLGLLPVRESWEVPAFLKIGGWNECPFPHEHAAIFRKWEREYAAEIACYTGDVIEFVVKTPPNTKEQAMKLAEEQFVYCSDIVFQGVETIENLAATLLNGKTWYFWWD